MANMTIFDQVAMRKVRSSRFDLTHDVKLSFSMGELVPTFCQECIPGDVFQIRPVNFLRFAPLISPVMHKVNVVTDYYFVPYRILWDEWEKFITGGQPGDPVPEMPYIFIETNDVGSVADYLGYPTNTTANREPLKVGILPIAAYLKIFDEYYRDQNLQEALWDTYEPVAGSNVNYADWFLDGSLLLRAWERDYFTSALPFAQKGDAVSIPLVFDDAEVIYQNDAAAEPKWHDPDNGNPRSGAATGQVTDGLSLVGGQLAAYNPDGTLFADVQASAATIETLRRAFRLQEWLERQARGGTRYIEQVYSHFGVKSSDQRLQRPEFIGRAKQNMTISEVLATAETTDAGIAVGSMAGHGISYGGGSFYYRAEEHGVIIGLINVQPTTAYQQGIHRMFTRFDKLDFAWPTFANLGEQSIATKELYAWQALGQDLDATWGYTPRYSEYKFANNRVAGEFRTTLNFWHLGRIFTGNSAPPLNEDFITATPITRIFAVTDPGADHIYAHVINQCYASRKLPYFGIPTI